MWVELYSLADNPKVEVSVVMKVYPMLALAVAARRAHDLHGDCDTVCWCESARRAG